MRILRNTYRGIGIAGLAAAFLAIAGCSETPLRSGTSFEQDGTPYQVDLLSRTDGSATGTAAKPKKDKNATFIAESDGWITGTQLVKRRQNNLLTVGNEEVGYSYFYVPRKAVSEDVWVTMSVSTEGAVAVEFEPEGLEFEKKTTLWLSYRGVTVPDDDENKLRLFYDNVDLGFWEWVPGSHADRSTVHVEAKLDHFSRYAVGTNP